MPQIRVLPDLLVNKIAAGEVIERPASVVKELVENSLDAGATRVEIAIEQGGQKLIRVSDNGSGMDAADLALCVRPHATSKIACEEDLFAIHTMGFRGEALASVGAVSQLRILTRPADADAAHEVRVVGDQMEPITVAAAMPGTTVEVRELFFNVPARRKFMRTPQTEMGHITEQLARIALVHPEVEFRLTHNGRLVHHLRPAVGMQSRVADFYGRQMADALMEVFRDERGTRITGYAARPADSRSSQKWQYFFLNGRYIRDRFIGAAVREAYRGLMDPSRCPVVFLSIEVDPAGIDVNVHPTKVEVRWRDSNLLYSQVLSTLRDRFLNADLTSDLRTHRATTDDEGAPVSGEGDSSRPTGTGDLPNGAGGTSDVAADESNADARRQQIRSAMADFFKRSQPIVGSGGRGGPAAPYSPRSAAGGFGRREPSSDRPDPANWPPMPGGLHDPPVIPGSHEPRPPISSRDASQDADVLLADDASMFSASADGRAFGDDSATHAIQIHRCYLVAETPDGVIIIDQHALHERVLFEQLSQQLSRGSLESQRLLLPEVIDVSPDQIGVIEQHEETLHRLGFEVSAYGPASVAVHAAPSLLQPERTREFIRDTLDRLADHAAPASTELLTNDLLSMMACKAAVKAGDALSPDEIAALMAQRPRVERSSNCPHGRPTSLRLSLRDLERQFKRTGF